MVKKRWFKVFVLTLSAVIVSLGFQLSSFAKNVKQPATSYQTVTEVKDWGATITKLIVEVGKPILKNSVTNDTFNVHVVREDNRLTNPFLEEGNRKIVNAYVSDKKGNPVKKQGKFVVLELEIGPSLTIGNALNYDAVGTGFNDWSDNKYTITQKQAISTPSGKLSNLVINTFAGDTKVLVDDFKFDRATFNDVTYSYAHYTPNKDKQKKPLIVWLHGGGEGGTDARIPISANKADHFASKKTQSYFGGAYVLVPQAPTYWMDGVSGKADGTSKYESSLMSLIKKYVAEHKDIDPNKIYVGGNSNGGYMTLLLTRDYPGYFAAAFPTCEGLNDALITNKDIENMIQTPTWFTTAKTDKVLPPVINTIPTYERFEKAGAKDVHLSLFNDVRDTSGLYKQADGSPFIYDGHSSWIYVYNNESTSIYNGKQTTIFSWLASQSK